MLTQILKESESKWEVSEACDNAQANLEKAARALIGRTCWFLEVKQKEWRAKIEEEQSRLIF